MNYFVSALIQLGSGETNPLVVQQYQQGQIYVLVKRQQKFWSKYSTASSNGVQFYLEYTCISCAIKLSFWTAQLRGGGAGPVLVYLIVDWSNANSTWLIMDEMHRVGQQWGGRFTNPLGIWELFFWRCLLDEVPRPMKEVNLFHELLAGLPSLERPWKALTILDHAYIVNLWPQI